MPAQRQALEITLTRGALSASSRSPTRRELATYAELQHIMGSGEAACLAMAETRGWLIAPDEKRRFRREVIARLGEGLVGHGRLAFSSSRSALERSQWRRLITSKRCWGGIAFV